MHTANVALAFLLGLSVLTNCHTTGNQSNASVSQNQNPQPTVAQNDPFAAAPRITVKELREAIKKRDVVVVDVSPAEAYELEHIKGAVSIPLDDVIARSGELPKDKLIVAYCA